MKSEPSRNAPASARVARRTGEQSLPSDGMSKPKVTIVTRLFAPEIGAAAFRQRALADAFSSEGAEVEVLTTRPPAGSSPVDDRGLRVQRWPVLRDSGGNVRGYVQYLSFDLPLALRALTARRPDVYVVEPPPTTGLVMRAVSRIRRRPYVWYAADVWSDAAGTAGAPGPLVSVLRMAETWVLRGASLVLSVSDGVTDRLIELGVAPEHVLTVGNGVDTAVFTPVGDVADSPEPYFVYAGTMSEWQGAGVFIEALAAHRSRGGRSTLVFLGQGSEVTALKALAQRLGPGAVEFKGVVPPAEAARYLRGARAALVSIRPGLGYDFAKPTKIYAAAASGTPVIFAGSGAGVELVRDAGLGWAVDHDPSAVAAAMDEAAAVTPEQQERRRPRLAEWAEANASIAAAGRRSAKRVLEVTAEQGRRLRSGARGRMAALGRR